MPIQIPTLTFQQIADAASQCLANHAWNGNVPVPIEDIVDVGYGIDLVPTLYLEDRFSTVAFITHDLKEILVDDFVFRKQPYRLRFSLAHELGHLVLHQSVYKQLAFETPDGWKESMTALGNADYRKLESQADAFGRLLLVPPAIFRPKFDEIAVTLAQVGKTLKQLPQDSQDYAVMGLARIFGVSSGAIWYRLRDEGLI
jgi:hypothetical protein